MRLLVEISLYPLTDIFVFHVFFGGGGGYSNNLLIHLIKFCFVFVGLIVSCFLKRILHFFVSLGHNLFFRRQSITKVNIKKIKTAELKACFKCFNLTIEAFALLCCFVVFNYHSIRNLLTTEKKESINHGRLFEIFTVHLQVHVSICEILICTTF